MRVENLGSRPDEGHRAGGARGPWGRYQAPMQIRPSNKLQSMNEELALMMEDIKDGRKASQRTNLGSCYGMR